MAEVRVELKRGDPEALFKLITQRTQRSIDGISRSVFIPQLNKAGEKFLREPSSNRGRNSEAEQGVRPNERGTGLLFGFRNVVRGRLVNPGTARARKGFGWPNLQELNKAPHWRALEFGLANVQIPAGIFSPEGPGAIFRRFEGADDRANLRRLTPGREVGTGLYGPIKAKHFLERAWEEVMTNQNVADALKTKFQAEFSDFRFTTR